jgi:hypothetical protein
MNSPLFIICLALFLLISGLSKIVAPIPNWLMILCGMCGVVCAYILLAGLLA